MEEERVVVWKESAKVREGAGEGGGLGKRVVDMMKGSSKWKMFGDRGRRAREKKRRERKHEFRRSNLSPILQFDSQKCHQTDN